jgi:serine protease Do
VGEANPRAARPTLHHFGTLIQTDAKLNLGTSGGALLNLDGELVGLTTALAAQAGYEQAAGYALPVDETFRRVVETLKQGREVEYGLLGVSPQRLSPEELRRGMRGARVASIDPSSAARRGGLRVGDIVTVVDGRPIEDEDALMLSIGRLPASASVKVEVLRGGQKLQLVVSLTKYPVLGKKIFTPQPGWRGVHVDYASVRTTGPFTYPFGPELYDGCVWVRDVEQDSTAWKSGLRPGMFITHVEDQRVGTPREFAQAIRGKSDVVNVRLGGLRPGEESVRAVRPNAG